MGLGYPSKLLDWSNPVAKVANADGSTSTVRTMSFNQDGKEVLVPTVHPDGYIMSNDQAVQRYRETERPENISVHTILLTPQTRRARPCTNSKQNF